ncbi:MAG TPA: penicillin-binding protein 2 [Anaerolineales bacterium]|nr:penicillin-binding protein 2 [Anaerolineales bacterium]
MRGTQTTQNTLEPARINAFVGILGFVFLVFVIQLFRLQILNGVEFMAEAEAQRTETLNLPTARGNIYDRNGIILAQNIPSYDIVVVPAELPDDAGEIQEIFRQLSALTGLPLNLGEISPTTPFNPCISEHGINQIVLEYGETTNPFRSVPVQCDVSVEVALVVQERAIDWPGVQIQVNSVRDYPTGRLTAAMVGFLGPIPAAFEEFYSDQGFVAQRDKVGYAGVELFFQEFLQGVNGQRLVEVDVAGQILRDISAPVPPLPGQNVHLTIDVRFQEAATAIVEQELTGWNNFLGRTLSNNAVVIAMNPQTGEILAMVTIPTYENNRFARIIPGYYYEQLAEDPLRPLFNHAISAEHPPGSVFKLATALGALNEGVVTPEQIIDTPGVITILEKTTPADPGRPREFVDWIYDDGANPGGFEQLDFIGGISNSSNVYFYKLSGGYREEVPDGGLGICRLKTYAEALGYGFESGIGLPGEQDGLLPDPRWKRINRGEIWTIGDMYNAGVGQGYVLATPLQVLLSGATIANDGILMRPTIVREIVDAEGRLIAPFAPVEIHDLTTDAVIKEYIQYVAGSGQCQETGVTKTVQPWVIDTIQAGMRRAVTHGTLLDQFAGFDIAAAGKTGTAEYCDNFAQEQNRCIPGNWPTHAWTIGYAPFDNPEIVVVAFVYNGGEGASVAGPIVRRVLDAYFQIRSVDAVPGP